MLGNRKSLGELPPMEPKNPNSSLRRTFIPGDILKDILSRLPVQSLLRFKCVNKLWNSIICDPDFALSSDHRAKAVFKTSVLWSPYEESYSICFMDDEGVTEEIPWGGSIFRDFIGGSCNGLLILVMDKSLFLWNPSTKYMRKVLELDRLCDEEYRVVSDLCFDSSRDDYKVVMGLAHGTPSYGGKFVIVASLKEKRWRTIKFPYEVSTIVSGPEVNGFLHWYVRDKDDDDDEDSYEHRDEYRVFLGPQKIVVFYPKIDEFKEFPAPDMKNRDENIILGLGVLGGCLTMVHWDHESDHIYLGTHIEVLVMKEYGVKESWTLLFKIGVSALPNLSSRSPLYTSIKPVMLMRNDEVALSYEGKIHIYNTKEMTSKSCIGCRPKIFVESLASPTCCEWDEKKHKDHLARREIRAKDFFRLFS